MNIDDTIREVERLYKSVTGSDVPPEGEAPYAAIPPEVDPQRYLESQIERLTHMLASQPVGATSPTQATTTSAFVPPLAVLESEGERVYRVDLPGVRRKDVAVSLEDSAIIIRGRREEEQGEGVALRWREAPAGRFERVVPLPRNIDDDELDVSMRDGCLEIRVPHKGPTSTRTLEIR